MIARLKLGSGGGSAAGGFRLGGRELALLSLAGAVLLALLWYFYLYAPTRAQSALLAGENAGLEAQVAVGRAARASLPELRAEVARLGRARDVFLAQLPEANEVAEMLDQLRRAARDANVSFTGLQNSGPGSEVVPGVRLLNFALTTEGNYGRTIGFLRALEALPRFTRVQRVALAAGTEAQADPTLSATYDFTVFVYTGLTAPVDPNAAPVDPNAAPVETTSEVQ